MPEKVSFSFLLAIIVGVAVVLIGLMVFVPQIQAAGGKGFELFKPVIGEEKPPEEIAVGVGEMVWPTYIASGDAATTKVYKLIRWWNPGYAHSERTVDSFDASQGSFICLPGITTECGLFLNIPYCCPSGTVCAANLVCCQSGTEWNNNTQKCETLDKTYYTFYIDLGTETVTPGDIVNNITEGFGDKSLSFSAEGNTYPSGYYDVSVPCGYDSSGIMFNDFYCMSGDECMDASNNKCCDGTVLTISSTSNICCPHEAPDYLAGKGCYKKLFDWTDTPDAGLGTECWKTGLAPAENEGSIRYKCSGNICGGTLKLRVGMLGDKWPMITFCDSD